ncbi:MAG: YdbC family protein [Ruminiclostridium sp.]
MAEFKYEITKELGVISEGSRGYRIELNMVSWNDREPKYDIRSWAPDHERMGKGISLTEEEMEQLVALWNARDEEDSFE